MIETSNYALIYKQYLVGIMPAGLNRKYSIEISN